VDRYFSKPWEDEKLIQAVEGLLAIYKADEFLAEMIEDAKGLKEEAEKAKMSPEFLEDFLNSYRLGVCVVGHEDKIEHLNKKGLEILKYKDVDEVKDRDFKDIFLMDETGKKGFRVKYLNKDMSSDRLDVKLNDGTDAEVLGSLTFMEDEGDVRVTGIVFDES